MMDEFEFTKMHGAGNDFIMIEDMATGFEETRPLISRLCERHRGIGADGLILIRPSDSCEFSMIYYNSDGSEAEMCGNGARCAALFANSRGIAGKSMSFSTGTGVVLAEVLDGVVRISMGAVTGLRTGITLPGDRVGGFVISGVPHVAVFVDDARGMDTGSFLETARSIRNDPCFGPGGTNVSFVTVSSKHRLEYRTYERGVEDETLACGTAAVGISVIAAHLGQAASPVVCLTSGGDSLETSFELNDDGATGCTLMGSAIISFQGRFSISGFDPSV
jgi:diaminopimelate epimerase